MTWKIQIERTSDNGYIISWKEQTEKDEEGKTEEVVIKRVIEAKEPKVDFKDAERAGELETFKHMVWELMDYFAIYKDKYSKYNFEIKTGVEDE